MKLVKDSKEMSNEHLQETDVGRQSGYQLGTAQLLGYGTWRLKLLPASFCASQNRL
jgi:hypothetical protein